ncbi:TetR/AcrR family transcriptional regulator [Streptosporangium subroseum]|uniref:TetR/AcrR family transcriptional regulator n=1 Tax=Streptosporangium subroseum TaxID=106412 RepID=UPI003084B247|nr:TetR/AcrR family transcriptional regulator [Streptosporangium subroseum]
MATSSRTKNRASRAERSRETRRRVVAAAGELFVRDGYLQTTMADIARQAGVAVQTLYLSFGSKVAVLVAALDVAIVGDDEPVPVLERPWVARLRDEPDGVAALKVFVEAASQVIDRVYPLYAATRDASADPELAEVLDRNKRLRFVTHGAITRELAAKAGFTPGLSVERATQIVYTLLSQETYGLLVVERGWTVPEWSDWVRRHIQAELFAEPPPS